MSARCRRSAQLLRADDQLCGASTEFVRPLRWAARVEIEIDAVLAQARDLLAIARVGHQMNQAQRGIAEMDNPALDQIGLVKAQRAGHPQAQLDRRETAPVGFEERRIHADRRSGLQAWL